MNMGSGIDNILTSMAANSINQPIKMVPASFSNEDHVLKLLNECNYNIKISLKDAYAGFYQRQVRVYADGVYDVFHSGHARQLMQAKNAFPNIYLIVGVCNQPDTNFYKGQTVMTVDERHDAVRHCRYVDEVVKDAPWSLDLDFLEKHKIDFVAHDDVPYVMGDVGDVYKFLKDRDMFLATQRTEGISSTDLISRMVKNYDSYLRHNIKCGVSRNDLNISYFKEKSIQFQEKYENLKQRSRYIINTTKQSLIDRWVARANDFMKFFTFLFEKTKLFRNKSIKASNILTPGNLSIKSEDELDTNSKFITLENHRKKKFEI